MKAISASILVFAGAFLLVSGNVFRSPGTAFFVQLAGGVLGLIGLIGWFISFREK